MIWIGVFPEIHPGFGAIMAPWESNNTFTTTEAAQIVALPCPGRCTIDRVIIVRLDTGAIDFTFFSRAFTNTPMPCWITRDPLTGNCAVKCQGIFQVKGGDLVTITGSSGSAYAAAQRVVTVKQDDQSFVTGTAWTVDSVGTIQLTIPASEQSLYQAFDEMTGTDTLTTLFTPGVIYINSDPQGFIQNVGIPQRIYALVANAGQYRVAIKSRGPDLI
jgi:hypothetical protein